MNVLSCPHARDGRCCRADCTTAAVHAGFTEHRGRLVEHQRCLAHREDLDQARVRQIDPRWKAVAG